MHDWYFVLYLLFLLGLIPSLYWWLKSRHLPLAVAGPSGPTPPLPDRPPRGRRKSPRKNCPHCFGRGWVRVVVQNSTQLQTQECYCVR